MNKYLLSFTLLSLCLISILFGLLKHEHAETVRLKNNRQALLRDVELYENRLNQSVASVEALRLTVGELQREKTDALKIIESLNVKLRRVESLSLAVAQSDIVLNAPLRDSVILSYDSFPDTIGCATDVTVSADVPEKECDTLSCSKVMTTSVKTFLWRDRWACVSGVVYGDSVECSLHHIDTLYQVVHRVPKRFLCFKYGVKAIRQEIVSTSPHSRIVYSEYVTLE